MCTHYNMPREHFGRVGCRVTHPQSDGNYFVVLRFSLCRILKERGKTVADFYVKWGMEIPGEFKAPGK